MMSFFQGKRCDINPSEIIKEGWLQKQSKYMKVWRDRWCVLSGKCLATFEKEKSYESPTEVIDISNVKTIKSDEKETTVLRVETNDGVFLFKSKSFEEKENWIGAIGKTMIKSTCSSIFIQEEE